MARKTKRAPTSRPKTPLPASMPDQPLQPRTGFGLRPDELERYLLTGEARGSLEDYFGPDAYIQLRDLARDASTRSVRGGSRVLILPGIMGSTLARKGLLGLENVLWVDPVEIARGRLTELRLGAGASAYHANGVILFAYLKLKLRLKIAGFDADFFPFDWRLSLATLGKALVEKIRQEPAPQVSLVAHSMGGLVARAALKAVGKKVSRLIMLGTPNYGSFAPVQAIRGAYDVVQKIAQVDLAKGHDAEMLSREVFSTFPGLYEMMPSPEKFATVDLYKAENWPQAGPPPHASLLSAVKPVIDGLAGADARFYLIAGVNQQTVIDVKVDGGEFAYTTSPDGDGTVPLVSAQLADIPSGQTYFVEEGHGGLPNNGAVEAAVVDLLSKGVTKALPAERPTPKRGTRVVSEGELRQMALRARGIGQLGSADYRHLLDCVAAPPRIDRDAVPGRAAAAAAAGAGSSASAVRHSLQNVTIGRRRQRRIEITLAHGSITEADAPAYVLGVFRNVAPSGTAKAIDERLDGAITEFTARRMFSGDLGAVFTVPVGRNRLPASMVLFAGLGPFDQFNADVQQLVAENVIRVLVRSRIDEFATVLIGAGSGQSASAVMQNLLLGFFRGLKDADPNQRFRGITLCETNGERYAEMKSELYRMAATSLFDDMELTLSEVEIPPPAQQPIARALAMGPEPIYAIVRQEERTPKRLVYQVSILGSGMKAAVVTAAKEIARDDFTALLNRFDKAVGAGTGGGDVEDLHPLGTEFANLVLPAEVCAVLPQMKDRHLVVVHDSQAAQIPWEMLTIGEWTPAVTGGLSRRYLADHLPVATWLEERRSSRTLNLLLVVNPTGDLVGAEKEGDRLLALANATSAIDVTQLRGAEATRASILSALRSGKFDCVHYAGHAFFDPLSPGRSGLLCAGEDILTGSDLTGISNLPSLIFFNACEAARVRKRPEKPATQVALESAGVAEALMRGGIANFMSTYWPVGDASAETFATTFYTKVLAGSSIGEALLEGRKDLDKMKSRDWADYILYGSYEFVLKQRSGEQR
jgi:pimeloyl-ACP methyl ester carboxylesterase